MTTPTQIKQLTESMDRIAEDPASDLQTAMQDTVNTISIDDPWEMIEIINDLVNKYGTVDKRIMQFKDNLENVYSEDDPWEIHADFMHLAKQFGIDGPDYEDDDLEETQDIKETSENVYRDIIALQELLGDEDLISELINWLGDHDGKGFVEHVRQQYDLNNDEEDDDPIAHRNADERYGPIDDDGYEADDYADTGYLKNTRP